MTFKRDNQQQYARPHDTWQPPISPARSATDNKKPLAIESSDHHVPSLRLQRGIFVFSCTSLVVGLLLACWNNPWRDDFLSPGPLSGSHAQIMASGDSNSCASCHGAGDRTLSAWIQDAVQQGTHIPISQSQRCMDCHEQSLAAEFALHAHNLSPKSLAKMTSQVTPNHSSFGFPDPRNKAGELACATCHREHHGSEFNLTALTDQQCQTCHVNYVHSFERDHPEFNNWASIARSSIAFDHTTHSMKHFVDKNEVFDCRQCHVNDERGNVKLLNAFEDSCAKCHDNRITGDHTPGWSLFELPILDTEALATAGYSIGLWPDACRGDFDGNMSPPMRVLLMANANAAEILTRRGNAFQFGDLNPELPNDMADATDLAWSIKELFFGLSIQGKEEVRERLRTTLGDNLADSQINDLLSGLNETVFTRAQRKWIPGLLDEMTSRNAMLNRFEQPAPTRVFARPFALDEDTLAINPLTDLYANAHENSAQNNPQPDLEITPLNTIIENATPAADATKHPDTHDGPDTLAPTTNDLLNSTTVPSRRLGIEKLPLTSSELVAAVDSALAKIPDYETHGGWYRDDQKHEIAWRISHHEDPVMKSWTELAMSHYRAPVIRDSGIFEELNSATAPGQCRSCHTTQIENDLAISMNWRPKYRNTSIKGFTRFSHQPHDLQTTLLDCTSCHVLDANRCNADSFESLDGTNFLSNFVPMQKNDCASCHRQGGAPSGCVDCHNYHVGSRLPSSD